jgi:Mrp family chromosome partitioning ATPase
MVGPQVQTGPENPLSIPELQVICRPLFVQLQSETPLGSPFTLGVTSSARGDGRSTIALGLASAAASQIGTQGKVLVIDADIENPTLHTRWGLPQSPGLYEVLTRQITMTQAIVEVTPGVWVLPVGSRPTNATHHLKKLEEVGLLEKLGTHFDAVIVDLPPVLTPELGLLPPRLVPRVVVVARSAVTKRDQLQNSIAAFPAGTVSAVILNEYKERMPAWLKRLVH